MQLGKVSSITLYPNPKEPESDLYPPATILGRLHICNPKSIRLHTFTLEDPLSEATYRR